MLKVKKGELLLSLDMFGYDLKIIKCGVYELNDVYRAKFDDEYDLEECPENQGTFYSIAKLIHINTDLEFENYNNVIDCITHEAVHAAFGIVAHFASDAYPTDIIGEEMVAYLAGMITNNIMHTLEVEDV